jgi:lipopolysaccharide/colanic/teichoic acid biosynthesis glycosyltransferase
MEVDPTTGVVDTLSPAPASANACAPVLPMPIAKRTLDVVLSGLGLLVSAPLWALIAGAVKLQDGGSVFYSQERVGEGGRPFRAFKFRSMIPDAETASGPLQAAEDDPRVTPVGRLLRATAMDELPQLWNIFRGDMSFVGPRALRPGEIEVTGNGEVLPLSRVPGYAARHRVRPGLTGIAQIFAPRDLGRRQKFRYDRLYIERRGFWLDLRLIALSFWITFRGRWEHRGDKVARR